jgi:hypothetical protein
MTFANLHPFFVHAPLVLLPTATIGVWLGRRIRKEGFELASLLLTVAAALGALSALVSGLGTDGTFPRDALLDELVRKHQYNGIAVTVIASLAAVLALVERRGLVGSRAFWVRALLLTWASIGVVTAGHSGASLVYLHGAAVKR